MSEKQKSRNTSAVFYAVEFRQTGQYRQGKLVKNGRMSLRKTNPKGVTALLYGYMMEKIRKRSKNV